MHVNRLSLSVVRGALTSAVCYAAFLGPLVFAGHTEQLQTLADGVYSTPQATRGQQLYQTECVTCHGDALQGLVGPPLTGERFLSIWSELPLRDLVDKIHNTMPPEASVPVSRQRSLDLSAYVLQISSFPAGAADLQDATLPQLSFPTASTARPPNTADGLSLEPTANLGQVMRSITFPNSNVIFNVQLKDPGAQQSPQPGSRPFDYVEWGATVYPGWQAIDLAALALVESTPLFSVPGRRCENGRPVPVDRTDWQEYTDALVDAGRAAYRASQSRSVDAVIEVADALNDACANCHAVYRDAASEGGGVGTDRCQQAP